MQFQEVTDEKKRLEGETDQLKAVLKREVDKLDAELVTRNNVISEYKVIIKSIFIFKYLINNYCYILGYYIPIK